MKSATILTVVLAAISASAVNKTWVGGAEGEWAEAANWDPSGAPGEGDVLVFDSTEPITVLLAETQSMAGLATTETTPLVTFKGLQTGSTIKARQDIKSGWKGPVTFDEHAHVQFIAGKVWWPEAEVKLLGGVSATSGVVPTLGMISGSQGRFVVRGSVDFKNGVNFAAPIDWDPSSVTEGSYYNVGSCDLQYNFAPAVEGHLIRFSGGTGGLGGTAPLTMESPDPTRPDTLINQYANPNLYLRRTMPTVIPNWFAICGAAACNNNRTGFAFGSGTELRIPGDVTTGTRKDYVSENPSGGLKLVFQGAGANVRLTGDNSYQGAGGSSTEIIHSNGVGYNSVEIDGEGTEIHPFGTGDVYSNNGNGLFIKPLSAGKTLVNGFSYGNSVNNNNAYTFAFDGSNDLTVSGDFTLGTAYSMIPVIGDMTLTLTGTLDPKDKNFDFAGTGNVVLGPTSQYTGSTGTLNKHSAGDLTLQGTLAGTSYNKAYFSGGKTTLDYTVNEGPRLNTPAGETALADALRLRGTELVLKGGAVAETVGEGNGTTFQNGLTKIRREGGSSTIYLGKLALAPTGAQGTAAAVVYEDGIARVDPSQANALLNGHHQVGDHFAKTDADGVITAAADDESANTTKITGSQSTGRLVNNLLVIEPTEAGQSVTLTSATAPMVANWDGMIFRGPHDFTVTGGQFGGASTWNCALVFNHCGTGVFTIDSELYRNGFTKIGPGTVRLTGKSTLGQSLTLCEGTFEVASANGFSDASKGNYQVYLNGGTLKTSVDVELVRPMSVGDNGGTIEVAAGTTFTQTSNAANTADNTAGPVVKTGAGTWLVAGDYQAMGKVRIEEGTVKLGSDKGLGDASARTRAIAPTELVGGTIDLAGFNAKLGNFYLKGGTVEDSSAEKTGSLAAYTHFVEAGTVNAPLANGVHQNGSCYFNATNLKKLGAGTVTLTADNTFQGTAYVEEGLLNLAGGSLASGVCVEGGRFTGDGAVAGYVYATDTGVFGAAAGKTLTLGEHLAVGDGGKLCVAADESGVAKIVLTKGNVYLGEEAELTFDLSRAALAKLGAETVVVDVPEGATVEGVFANFTGGKYRDARGNKYTVTYTGGDGNDIAVTASGAGFVVEVR